MNLNFKKNKKEKNNISKPTANTTFINNNIGLQDNKILQFFSEMKLKPFIILSFLVLVAGIYFNYYYGVQVSQEQQIINYTYELNNLSRKIDTLSVNAQLGEPDSVLAYNHTENEVSSILNTLKNGGSLNGKTAIKAQNNPFFNTIFDRWNQKNSLALNNLSIKNINDYYKTIEKEMNISSSIRKEITLGTLAVILFLVVIQAFILYERSLRFIKLNKLLEKNQNNEGAVEELFSKMQPLDDGDFTKVILVKDPFVFKISQRIDKSREVFSNIIKKIKTTSENVYSSADNTENTSQRLLEVSHILYEKLDASIKHIGDITNSMDEIAQSSWIAQDGSSKSREASQKGFELVKQAISKMDLVRQTIQESSKKIKKLGESAQAITEVTGIIQDITKQINILALNSAIQAASSGESSREFTIVAQEVQRLADDSAEATKKIEKLIFDIQADTAASISSMEKTTQEVVQGARLTDTTGSALKEIDEFSQFVMEQVESVAKLLEEKSSEMATIALDMQKLQEVSKETTDIVNLTATQVETLKQISDDLKETTEGYKV